MKRFMAQPQTTTFHVMKNVTAKFRLISNSPQGNVHKQTKQRGSRVNQRLTKQPFLSTTLSCRKNPYASAVNQRNAIGFKIKVSVQITANEIGRKVDKWKMEHDSIYLCVVKQLFYALLMVFRVVGV